MIDVSAVLGGAGGVCALDIKVTGEFAGDGYTGFSGDG